MAFVSEAQMAKFGAALRKSDERIKRFKAKAEERAGKVRDLATTTLGGAMGGYISGRLGDAAGKMTVFGFNFDPALAGGVAFGVAGLLDVFGKYSDDALNVGGGMLSYSIGKYAFDTGQKGKQAGTLFGEIPYGEPEILGPSAGYGSPSSFYMGAEVDAYAESLVE